MKAKRDCFNATVYITEAAEHGQLEEWAVQTSALGLHNTRRRIEATGARGCVEASKGHFYANQVL